MSTLRTKPWSRIFDTVAMAIGNQPNRKLCNIIQIKKISKIGLHGVVALDILNIYANFQGHTIFRSLVTLVTVLHVCDFAFFEISAKTFQKYKNW